LDALEKAGDPPEPILRLLGHLFSAERIWLMRIRQEETSKEAVWAALSLAQCRAVAEEAKAGFREIIQEATEDRLAALISYRTTKGQPMESSLQDILFHVALHGSYHRGQIATLLRREGLEPVGTDFITFARNIGRNGKEPGSRVFGMDPCAEYRISLDPSELQMEVIHGFLTRCYWSRGIPLKVVEHAAKNSLVAGAYQAEGSQVGFARLVTDHATFGYLCDLFVLEEHRGRGLSIAMTKALLELPEVKCFRRIMLATRDAHGVYEKCGFQRIDDAAPFMQILRRNIYPTN
jgi:uncharacterized damage-inducible protein DinB/GNAT superfamily N-acetyltransferase